MNTSNQTFVNNLRDKYSTKPQMQTYHESPPFVFDKGHTTQRTKPVVAGKIRKTKQHKSKQVYKTTNKKMMAYILEEDTRQRSNRTPEKVVSQFKAIENLSRREIKYESKGNLDSKKCIENVERVQRNIRKILQNV